MAMLSSPLAAMRPPPNPTIRSWGCGSDAGESLSRKAANNSFGRSTKFNFAELAMNGMGKDYFSQPTGGVRGSSPTASLAADLSQNFYIDQSPQLPTPRRSLFNSGVFTETSRQEGVTTPPIHNHWESATTPNIPSSSPAYGADAMEVEMSPLPHKLPFSMTSRQIDSPSRKMPSLEMVPPPRPTSVPSMEQRPSFAERKKSTLQRPSLSRTKCMSTSQIVPRARENQLPPFTFGAGITAQPTTQPSQSMSIEEAFTESPLQQRNIFSNPVAAIPRSKFQSSLSNGSSRGNGSPLTKKQLAPSALVGRPRKQFRRTLSMFEHPADVMKTEKKETTTQLDAIMDIDETYQMKIPSFVSDEPMALPRINQEVMIRILDGEFKSMYDNVMIIDCRFEYEYSGGHVDGAYNFNDREHLARHLFDSLSTNTLLILHCEYSAHRAPRMARYIREQDRAVNAEQYPKLSYPEMYILDGGYSAFFKNYRARCYPQNYVEMEANGHELACERGMGKVRQRSKLSRAVTYAFGQPCAPIGNSPSRPGSSSTNEIDTDLFMPLSRMHPRRSASN